MISLLLSLNGLHCGCHKNMENWNIYFILATQGNGGGVAGFPVESFGLNISFLFVISIYKWHCHHVVVFVIQWGPTILFLGKWNHRRQQDTAQDRTAPERYTTSKAIWNWILLLCLCWMERRIQTFSTSPPWYMELGNYVNKTKLSLLRPMQKFINKYLTQVKQKMWCKTFPEPQ